MPLSYDVRLLESTWQATRAKEVFAKHVESVLSKCGKLRNLIADLQKTYPDDGTAKKYLISIKQMH